jgi:PAS domain S-box-containing protein
MWQYTPYNLPLAFSTLLSAMVLAYIWGQRREQGAWPLGVLMLGVALWSLGAALEVASVELVDKMQWTKLLYIGIVMVPGAWFYFALQYSGRTIGQRAVLWLVVEPVLVLLVVWNDALHGFYWQRIELVQEGGYSIAAITQGTGFWLHATYSYVLLLVGLVALVRRYARVHGPYKKQIGALIAASTIPWLANILYLFSLNPFPLLDLTPFAFAFTGVISVWALFRFRLFDLRPVARDLLIEHMSYGVLVLDDKGRVVDTNPAARALFASEQELVGLEINRVSQGLAAWLRDLESGPQRVELSLQTSGCICEVSLFPLDTEEGESRGHLVMLQDISERKRVETEGSVARQMREEIWGMERGGDIDKVLESALCLLRAQYL